MKRTIKPAILALAIVLAAASPALAWDGPGMWYSPADGGPPSTLPGGGGILGTGGQHDHGIKCSDCHVQRPDEPNLRLDLAFSPALSGSAYTPGQRYTVTATLSGAQVQCASGPNGGGTTKVDNFAASFEDDAGATAGTLAADSGPCRTIPQPTAPGTTVLDGDCAVIFAKGSPNTTQWTFTWTAPASGGVHIYWGAVDGNCDMMSMGDAVTNGSRTLAPAPAARDLLVVRIVAAVLFSWPGIAAIAS